VEGIKAIVLGNIFLSPDIALLMADETVDPDEERTKKFSQLSPREREVLQFIAEGHTSKGIADKLGISSKTVDIHRNNVKKKLDIRSVAGLTKFALAKGVTLTLS